MILIAEQGTNLPSDITSQRTIFYYNDAKGTLELQKDILKGKYHDARKSIATFLYETPSLTIGHQRLLAFYYFIHCMQKNEKKYNTEEERIDIIYDFCRHMESFTKKNEDKECTSTQEINYNIEDIQKHFNDIFIFSQSENKKDITNKETSEETSQKQQ